MLKEYFVNQGLRMVQIEEFIKARFPEGNYSHMELQRTPLGIKVVIHSASPGRIIGRGGKIINELTDALREKFSLENPQVDVKSVPNPNLDARIVASQIAQAIERGFNFKRIGNVMAKKVMDAGAVGVEIVIGGKVTGSKAMRDKFISGYIKHSGSLAKELVDDGFAEVYRIGKTVPGKIGIRVRIMREFQTITGERRSPLRLPPAAEGPPAAPEPAPPNPPAPPAPPAEPAPQPEAPPPGEISAEPAAARKPPRRRARVRSEIHENV